MQDDDLKDEAIGGPLSDDALDDALPVVDPIADEDALPIVDEDSDDEEEEAPLIAEDEDM